MSATLTWYSSGLGTKTNTTNAALLTDMKTLIDSKAADANFKWQSASISTGGNPLSLVLKRKDGSAGRIMFLIYTSNPANFNTALWLGASAIDNNYMYTFWHPAGNVDSPSNLAAASGAVLGDDTGATGYGHEQLVGTIYAANIQPFYFDCDAGMVWCFQNVASAASPFAVFIGDLVVDASDTAYGCVAAHSATSLAGAVTASTWSWKQTGEADSATTGNSFIRTNYGTTTKKKYYQAWGPTGWASPNPGSTDIMTDDSNSKVWFAAMPLIGNKKGEGIVLKFRQIAYGPGAISDFKTYQSTGPVLQARMINAFNGSSTSLWLTQFKI